MKSSEWMVLAFSFILNFPLISLPLQMNLVLFEWEREQKFQNCMILTCFALFQFIFRAKLAMRCTMNFKRERNPKTLFRRIKMRHVRDIVSLARQSHADLYLWVHCYLPGTSPTSKLHTHYIIIQLAHSNVFQHICFSCT